MTAGLSKCLSHMLLGAAVWMLAHIGAAAQPTPLRLGVLPNISTGVLLTNYQPLRAHLARELARPVEVFTAKDFASFYRAMRGGRYDVVVTAAHMARLAQREDGWIPVASYRVEHRPVLLMSKNKPLASIKDLAGHRLAIADRAALLVISALHGLSQQGLKPGRDYQLTEFQTFSAAAHALQQGDVALAVASPVSMRQTPESVLRDLTVFAVMPRVPAQVWLVAPVSHADATRVRDALLKFSPGFPDADRFFNATGNVAIGEISAEEMRALDPLADEAKALLQVRP